MKKLVLVGLVLALSGGSVGASVAQDNVKAQIALGARGTTPRLPYGIT